MIRLTYPKMRVGFIESSEIKYTERKNGKVIELVQ